MTLRLRSFATHLIIFALAVSFTACLPPSGSGGGGGGDALTQEEIADSGVSGSALDLIRALRPTWLTTRGPNTRGTTFYVDDTQYSQREIDNLLAAEVNRAVYLSPQQAQTRYGSGNENGAVVFTTK